MRDIRREREREKKRTGDCVLVPGEIGHLALDHGQVPAIFGFTKHPISNKLFHKATTHAKALGGSRRAEKRLRVTEEEKVFCVLLTFKPEGLRGKNPS